MQVRYSAMLIAFLILISCGKDERVSEQVEVADTTLVKGVIVNSDVLFITHSFSGVVVESKPVILAFPVPGQVYQISVKEGQKIKKGQLIARIAPHLYQHQQDQALTELERTKEQRVLAKRLVRQREISPSALDLAEKQYEAAKQRYALAKQVLSGTRLKAPVDGQVTKIHVDIFQDVVANQAVVNLQALGSVDIEAEMPEQFYMRLSKQTPRQILPDAEVVFADLPDKRFPLSQKAGIVRSDDSKQTNKVTLTVPLPDELSLNPGAQATIVFYTKTHKGEFVIPSKAVVVDSQGKHYVWVLDHDQKKAFKRSVEVGDMSGEYVIVSKGLEAGDYVLTTKPPTK